MGKTKVFVDGDAREVAEMIRSQVETLTKDREGGWRCACGHLWGAGRTKVAECVVCQALARAEKAEAKAERLKKEWDDHECEQVAAGALDAQADAERRLFASQAKIEMLRERIKTLTKERDAANATLLQATEAFNEDGPNGLGVINESVQPLIDAVVAWGDRIIRSGEARVEKAVSHAEKAKADAERLQEEIQYLVDVLSTINRCILVDGGEGCYYKCVAHMAWDSGGDYVRFEDLPGLSDARALLAQTEGDKSESEDETAYSCDWPAVYSDGCPKHGGRCDKTEPCEVEGGKVAPGPVDPACTCDPRRPRLPLGRHHTCCQLRSNSPESGEGE
jgi:hypothetical protein